MLICPQCQFENPNTNKFCQRCGTSLIHKTCEECDTQVPLDAETCHNCGALTGTVLCAIITRETTSLPAQSGLKEVSHLASEQVNGEATALTTPQLEVPTAVNSEPPDLETASVEILPPKTSSDVPSQELEAIKATPSPTQKEESLGKPQSQTNLAPQTTEPDEENRGQEVTTISASEDSPDAVVSSQTPEAPYLDSQQRYRLLESWNREAISANPETGGETSVRVVDCQPFQKSLLDTLKEQQTGDPHSQSSNLMGIPAIAQPYLELRERYYPTLPDVHDAWQQDGEVVVLLEDRSRWQLLSDLWGSEELSTLQILYWLDEMAKLWQALEPWHCRQSLLEITNLRVDEDQVLGLVRLYQEPKNQQLTLEDLGQMWRMLFSQSQRTQLTSLGTVFRQLCTGEIGTIEELRFHLEAIAHAEQIAVAKQIDAVSQNPLPEEAEISDLPTYSSQNQINSSPESGEIPTVILPMQLLSLDDAGCTDIGHQREHNEDCFGIQTQVKKHETPIGRSLEACGLYILCDGMGGHAAGEVASSMAVETIKKYFQKNWQDGLPSEEIIHEAVRVANQAIYDVNQQNARSGSGRMGTTLAIILIQNTKVAIAHVGDSRVYRLTRKRGLEQLTVDHEVGQREITRGVDPDIAYSRPDAYQLTQAVGPRSNQFINPDVQFLELNEDTLFVLCSDGLSDNHLIETHWQTHLAPLLSSRANLDQGILQLIDLANEHNGHDNITAVLIRLKVRPNFEQQRW
ncbi:MAG TPA: protein phosphatase [Cyanobacteria bacterium UBA8803]|nr:protein phosphatase [Cyanobacteria bacterium UBA9273]HBL58944.1 protein phosphatase [Cyanobacteria bacterium UBA8803]